MGALISNNENFGIFSALPGLFKVLPYSYMLLQDLLCPEAEAQDWTEARM